MNNTLEAVAPAEGGTAVSRFEQDFLAGRVRVRQDGRAYTPTSWATIDLEPIKNGDRIMPAPEFLRRTDGQALIYPGRPHVFFGPSESLKSWAALLACWSYLDRGLTALYVDFEGNEMSFVERSRLVGMSEDAIGHRLGYIRPTEPLKDNQDALSDLLIEEDALEPSLVVLDGVSEAYALHGWDINRAEDAAKFQRLFGNFADGTATIVIDHSGKDATRGVVGSQHKRAGLDGAEYEFSPRRREGRGGHSEAAIRVTKDRHGSVREFTPKGEIGRIHVADTVWIEAPSYAETFGQDEALMTALLDWIRANPGQSTKAVKDAVLGSATAIGNALQMLEADGRVCHTTGLRNAKLWFPAGPTTPREVAEGVIERYRERGQVTE